MVKAVHKRHLINLLEDPHLESVYFASPLRLHTMGYTNIQIDRQWLLNRVKWASESHEWYISTSNDGHYGKDFDLIIGLEIEGE